MKMFKTAFGDVTLVLILLRPFLFNLQEPVQERRTSKTRNAA